MKKLMAIGTLLVSGHAFACGIIDCYDSCTNSYQQVYGDTCTSTYDPQQGCFRADGNCGGNCFGSIYCYDYCQNQYISFQDSNTCGQVYDYQHGCYRADGYCSQK